MNDYIERKALLDELCRDNCERTYDGTCHNCRMTETIADFPSADVAPVVHGKWEHDERYEDWADQYLCSVCKYRALTDGDYIHKLSAYCPTCGAKMDLERLEREYNSDQKLMLMPNRLIDGMYSIDIAPDVSVSIYFNSNIIDNTTSIDEYINNSNIKS